LIDSPKKIYFYSSSKTYSEFSNFYESPTYIDGKLYLTNEHYYQSQKFLDEKISERIRNAQNPMKVKELSHKYKDKIRPDWNNIKVDIMRKGIEAKFSNNMQLKMKLLLTGNAILVEDNISDNFWGSGVLSTGKNVMGKLLMEFRDNMIKK